MQEHCVYSKDLDDWRISWESTGSYRLWCKQEHRSNTDSALVVMFNPGSLSGSGSNLRKDTTLRILREVFQGTGYNPFIINLFTLATPKPNDLFKSWSSRDCPSFELQSISPGDFSAIMYAYGAYELRKEYSSDIKRRIRLVKSHFDRIPEIVVPLASSNTPKHPMRVQIEGLKDEYRSRIAGMFNAKNG